MKPIFPPLDQPRFDFGTARVTLSESEQQLKPAAIAAAAPSEEGAK
tara:strand:- start:526 stop:663 length:138 start_codon:yes stop_codon:yes gene_type:complete